MPDVPPGRPIRNNSSSQTREKHQVYLLLMLGVGLLGAGAAALGLAARSVAAVGIGAGAMVAAGLLSVFFALVESRRSMDEGGVPKNTTSAAWPPHDPDPDNQRPAWPPRTSPRSPIE